jgi:hypothetical protein
MVVSISPPPSLSSKNGILFPVFLSRFFFSFRSYFPLFAFFSASLPTSSLSVGSARAFMRSSAFFAAFPRLVGFPLVWLGFLLFHGCPPVRGSRFFRLDVGVRSFPRPPRRFYWVGSSDPGPSLPCPSCWNEFFQPKERIRGRPTHDGGMSWLWRCDRCQPWSGGGGFFTGGLASGGDVVQGQQRGGGGAGVVGGPRKARWGPRPRGGGRGRAGGPGGPLGGGGGLGGAAPPGAPGRRGGGEAPGGVRGVAAGLPGRLHVGARVGADMWHKGAGVSWTPALVSTRGTRATV